jgi:hypothetical protein
LVKIVLKSENQPRRFTYPKDGRAKMPGIASPKSFGNFMLEFEPNTIAIMTASLEQCCKQLKSDTPEARKFVADRLRESARLGRVSLIALTQAGEEAVKHLNGSDEAGGWRTLFQWAV